MSVVVSLEVTSTGGAIGEPMLGILRVKLCEQVNTDAAAITTLAKAEHLDGHAASVSQRQKAEG